MRNWGNAPEKRRSFVVSAGVVRGGMTDAVSLKDPNPMQRRSLLRENMRRVRKE